MRIAVAQTRPVKGDILRNIASHKTWSKLAVDYGAEAIIFPELSLTGYEPELAKKLAITADDPRLDDFQDICERREITIGVGVPIRNSRGINISMLLFYIVSVAKSVQGLESAIPTLAEIATRYNMTVLMSNCVGPCEGFESAGRSSVWNSEGKLLRQLNGTSEGVLIVDTITEHVTEAE